MLLGGILARNTISIVSDIQLEWSIQLRTLALTVILLRAGLGLDVQKVRQNSGAVLRLTGFPQLVEALVTGVACYLVFDIPWAFCFALGFMIGAVSPAVVVPACIKMMKEGIGTDKGIPSIIVAASSLDDVLAISCKF